MKFNVLIGAVVIALHYFGFLNFLKRRNMLIKLKLVLRVLENGL